MFQVPMVLRVSLTREIASSHQVIGVYPALLLFWVCEMKINPLRQLFVTINIKVNSGDFSYSCQLWFTWIYLIMCLFLCFDRVREWGRLSIIRETKVKKICTREDITRRLFHCDSWHETWELKSLDRRNDAHRGYIAYQNDASCFPCMLLRIDWLKWIQVFSCSLVSTTYILCKSYSHRLLNFLPPFSSTWKEAGALSLKETTKLEFRSFEPSLECSVCVLLLFCFVTSCLAPFCYVPLIFSLCFLPDIWCFVTFSYLTK